MAVIRLESILVRLVIGHVPLDTHCDSSLICQEKEKIQSKLIASSLEGY